MSIIPRRNDGSVFKRWINIKRPFAAAPPTYGLQVFYATTETPNPAENVDGLALAERLDWETFIKPSAEVLTFESVSTGQQMAGTTTTCNGIVMDFPVPQLFGSDVFDPITRWIGRIGNDTFNGRFNTTSGGNRYINNCVTWSDQGPPPADQPQSAWNFLTPISAFGLYMTDLGDFLGTIVMRITRSDNVQFSYTIVDTFSGGLPLPNGALTFFGFVDGTDTYTKVEWFCDQDNTDAFGIDDVVWGPYSILVGAP